MQTPSVSIPLRQAKNFKVMPFGLEGGLVSIPLRQAKNFGGGSRPVPGQEFQFLLGRLKT